MSHSAQRAAGVFAAVGAAAGVLMLFLRSKRCRARERESSRTERRAVPRDDFYLSRGVRSTGSLRLDEGVSVKEANARRTASYAAKAAEACQVLVCPGTGGDLARIRSEELSALTRRHREGRQSHRTVIALLDEETSLLLEAARRRALGAVEASVGASFSEARDARLWIPGLNVIPREHLHITVATPWWWRAGRDSGGVSFGTDASRAVSRVVERSPRLRRPRPSRKT